MERVLSPDERIRRAEEIYARRKIEAEARTSATVNVHENKSSNFTRKLIIQFVVCVLIYSGFYAIKNVPNLVSQDVMYKITDILEYDINFQELYSKFTSNKNVNNSAEQNEEYNNELVQETLSVTETLQEENVNKIVNEHVENIITQTVGEENTGQVVATQDTSNLSQSEIDALYIKSNYSFIKPLEGEITSRFGPRNPSIPTVPKYHTGIDIARVVGTVIVSAMEGKVELVSDEGDLRKPCKNNKWRSINSICTL